MMPEAPPRKTKPFWDMRKYACEWRPVSCQTGTPVMRVYRQKTLFFVLFVSVLSSATTDGKDLSDLVIFGDSLSDTGNFLTRHSLPATPPYAEGCFSDGLIWVEHLADYLMVSRPLPSEGNGLNYAWGGATTGSRSPALPVATVDEQVSEYLAVKSPESGQLFIL